MQESKSEATCPQRCANCSAVLNGRWCHTCGQKAVRDEEQRLGWIVRQWLGRLTSFDGKLPRSLLALVARPGRLGREWSEGRRARWSSPFSLFLVVNLVYFILSPLTDFNLPLRSQLQASGYAGLAQASVEERVPGTVDWVARRAEMPEAFPAFERTYNRTSEGLSKTLIIFHVPPTALALMLLHRRRRRYFVDHFVQATHYWSLLLLSLIVIPALSVAVNGGLLRLGWVDSIQAGETYWKSGLVLSLVGYLWMLVRRAYGESWWLAGLKAMLTFVACAGIHFTYRGILFAVTMARL